MDIVIRKKVHKTIKTAPTKSCLMANIRNMYRHAGYISSTRFGNGIATDNEVIAFSLEKVRTLKKQSVRASFVTDHGNVRKTKIEKKAHWNANVYVFNIETLQAAGLKIKQGVRTFKIVDKTGNEMSVQEYKKHC